MTTNTPPIGPGVTSTDWLDRLSMLGAHLRPDWDRPGIRSALVKVADRPLQHVAMALLLACSRVDQRTPAVIALDGPHWHAIPGAEAPEPVRIPAADRCDQCDQGADECQRRNDQVAPDYRHEFTPRRPRKVPTGTRLNLPELRSPVAPSREAGDQ